MSGSKVKSKAKKEPNVSNLEKGVLEVLTYFDFFKYAPSFEDIHRYLPVKATKSACKYTLTRMVKHGLIEESDTYKGVYAMPGKGIFVLKKAKKAQISNEKLAKMLSYVAVLQKLSSVQLIGLSGSCTMGNAHKSDDVDLFIIASPNRLWTARFASIMLAYIYGVKRQRKVKKAPDKVCLNMFFDASDVSVPGFKRNMYTAHEVLQMKPLSTWITDKNRLDEAYITREQATYNHFIRQNMWVRDYLPNFTGRGRGIKKKPVKKTPGVISVYYKALEFSLKKLQLFLMRNHRTTEIITDTQLWFFPKDFEKKVHKVISQDS